MAPDHPSQSKVQYWQFIDIPRPISSYCFYKDICPSPNLYPNLLQLQILHLYVVPEVLPLCEHFVQAHTDLPSEISPDFFVNCIISVCSDSEQFVELMYRGLSIVNNFPF